MKIGALALGVVHGKDPRRVSQLLFESPEWALDLPWGSEEAVWLLASVLPSVKLSGWLEVLDLHGGCEDKLIIHEKILRSWDNAWLRWRPCLKGDFLSPSPLISSLKFLLHGVWQEHCLCAIALFITVLLLSESLTLWWSVLIVNLENPQLPGRQASGNACAVTHAQILTHCLWHTMHTSIQSLNS